VESTNSCECSSPRRSGNGQSFGLGDPLAILVSGALRDSFKADGIWTFAQLTLPSSL
jgi:hypothetical protein